MRSTFGGFNTATSGLFAAQRALDIVGHNLANVNTPGYSRQRLNQSTARPMQLPGGKGPIGLGAEMVSITQIRNEFLDIQYRKEHMTMGFWEEKQTFFTQIESIFNEPTDKSIRKIMDKFYAAMNKVSENAADPTARKVMVESGVAFCENLNFMAGRFEKLIEDLDMEIGNTVRNINTYGNQIATLNEQIFNSEIDGSHANDLRDKRNLILDELSKLVNIQVVNVPDVASDGKYSKMNVLIHGTGLVMHDSVNQIAIDRDQEHPLTIKGKKAIPPRDDLSNLRIGTLRWESGSYIHQDALEGVIGAQMDMRDNFEGDEKGIPYYLRMINEFASKFAEELNKIHSHEDSRDLNNQRGIEFFRPDGDPNIANTKRITARNIKINQRIIESPALVAASRVNQGDPTHVGVDNNQNIKKLINIREDIDFSLQIQYQGEPVTTLGKGKPDDVMKSLVGVLGVDAHEAKRKLENQLTITESIQGFRMSISGVSQDEEMSNMIKYQHAYNAAARMITTIDEMIDVIINRMGRVGL